MQTRFRDRTEAGKELARSLSSYANRADTLVLGLPRGGVPVAHEVAQALNLPLDICIVRKLGVPNYPELAMGAIASGGVRILNQDVIQEEAIPEEILAQVTADERRELQRREQAYRGDRPQPTIRDRTIIVVDDGLATGATMRTAIALLRSQRPKAIVVAVPIAPLSVCKLLDNEVDIVICLMTPDPFYAISLGYDNFTQVTDMEVRKLLAHREL